MSKVGIDYQVQRQYSLSETFGIKSIVNFRFFQILEYLVMGPKFKDKFICVLLISIQMN